MKKKTSSKDRIIKNLNQTIPFVGLLLIISGILGLIFIQQPLKLSQDNRSEASESKIEWPNLTSQNPDQELEVDEETTINYLLDTVNQQISEVTLIFNIVNDSIETPRVSLNGNFTYNENGTEVEQTDDGYIISILATPSDLVNPFVQPNNVPFLEIKLTPTKTGTVSISFDQEKSYISTTDGRKLALDTYLEKFNIISNQPVACTTDVQRCPDGTYVGRATPDCSFEACPGLSQCNESCETSSNCEVGHRCYNSEDGNKCRLATNVSSTTCQTDNNKEVTYRQCNQSCANSRDCQAGLACWNGSCRNPNNVDNSSCANLTTTQQTASIESCGGNCDTNADCAVNLRCYNSECRLASNPSSTSCSAATTNTVSLIYTQEDSNEQLQTPEDNNGESDDEDQKGKDKVPSNKIILNPIGSKDPSDAEYSDTNNIDYGDESLLDLFKSLIISKQQTLPIAIIAIGLILLILSILVFIFKKITAKPKPPIGGGSQLSSNQLGVKTHEVKPATPPTQQAKTEQSTTVKNLMKQLDEESKKQN